MKRLSLLLLLILFSCTKDPVMYDVTISAAEGGIVSPQSGSFEVGSSVTFTATPSAEYEFSKWSNGSTQNPLVLTVTSDLILQATFTKKQYELTISKEGEGTVSEKVINSGKGYDSGTMVELTALPSVNWEFIGWSGSISGTTNPQQLVINGPKIVSAIFKRLNPIYTDENGVTIKAYDWASIGEKGIINGIEYTIIDEATLRDLVGTGQDVTKVVTTRVTNMSELFNGSQVFNQPIGNWDTSNVTDMQAMFMDVWEFNQPINYWDTSSVTNMLAMFRNAYDFNQPIGNWDVSSVTNMNNMFKTTRPSSFNQDLSNWCVIYFQNKPESFDEGASEWTLPKPVWGTCPN